MHSVTQIKIKLHIGNKLLMDQGATGATKTNARADKASHPKPFRFGMCLFTVIIMTWAKVPETCVLPP